MEKQTGNGSKPDVNAQAVVNAKVAGKYENGKRQVPNVNTSHGQVRRK